MRASPLKSPGLFAVFCPILIMLSYRLFLISKFSSPFTNPSGIVPSAPTTDSITVPFLIFLKSFRYLSVFSPSFNFTLWSVGTKKSTTQQVLFFLLMVEIM